MPVDRVAELWRMFAAERVALGLDRGALPMRRDVAFGADRAEALATFLARAAQRYRSYAANERTGYARPSAESIGPRLIHGTVQDCAGDVVALAKRVPLTTLIVRPHWTDMSRQELLAYLAQLGELVDALR